MKYSLIGIKTGIAAWTMLVRAFTLSDVLHADHTALHLGNAPYIRLTLTHADISIKCQLSLLQLH